MLLFKNWIDTVWVEWLCAGLIFKMDESHKTLLFLCPKCFSCMKENTTLLLLAEELKQRKKTKPK